MIKTVLFLTSAVTLMGFLSFQPKQKFDLKASISRGQEIYSLQCMACHQDRGQGIEDVYPPLAKSDYLMADKKRSIRQVIHGANGEIKVNGEIYNSEMLPIELSDQEASDVLNYVRNSWGNKGAAVTPAEVAAARK